jgi:uncharacterized membrane protein
MVLVVLTAVFLGSFTLLFTIWLITWSFIMRPIALRVNLLELSAQDLAYDLSGNEAIPSLKA